MLNCHRLLVDPLKRNENFFGQNELPAESRTVNFLFLQPPRAENQLFYPKKVPQVNLPRYF